MESKPLVWGEEEKSVVQALRRSPGMKPLTFAAILLFLSPSLPGADLSDDRRDALALQLFLDAENFGPGRVDGRSGEFTSKAAERWNKARSDNTITFSKGAPDAGEGRRLWKEDILTQTTLSDSDFKNIGEVPKEPSAMAGKDSLPYENVLEMISEKFRADRDFIKELNPSIKWENVGAEDKITVPNVKAPFSAPRKRDEPDDKPINDEFEVTLTPSQNLIEVRRKGKLEASFPVSIGEAGNATPVGEWKVNVIQWMPQFRYDEKMLEEGKRSDEAYMLPPGPNSPVGIVWIGLDADGIGIHGTENPHDIGRNTSAGCIRLSNWDAKTLGDMISVGTKVIVRK